MMTRAHRQEALSKAYVRAVAALAGVLCSEPEPDYGIDLSLRSVEVQKRRHSDTSVQLDLQLRSTTRSTVTQSGVAYDLDRDTYDHLRNPEAYCPRVLVVLVLPANEEEWLSQSPSELMIRHCAYWLSLKGYPATRAKKSIRVTIPLDNVFSPEAIRTILERVKERKEP